MKLSIADLEFSVLDCRFEAYCHEDKMQWDVIVECEGRPDAFNGSAPSMSLSLFESAPSAFEYWTGIAPREVQWTDKNGTDDTPSGILYVFEHEPIFDCSARCFDDSGRVGIKLDGRCDIHFNEEYGAGIPFGLEATAAFRGVWFGRRPEAECRAEISRFLAENDFDFTPTEHGVSMLTPKNAE